jgi:signal transduction histidine kinase
MLAGLALLLFLTNVAYVVELRRLHRLRAPDVLQQIRRLANVQVVLDLIVLTALIHTTGGIENPLLFFYVFHVVIAGILLSYRMAYVHATLGTALVLLLEGAELTGVLPHQSVPGFAPEDLYRTPAYVAGVLFAFASTVYLAAYLSGSISGELRKRQREVLALNAELAAQARSLQAANERLTEMDHQRAVFLSIASHDLRAPLVVVLTYLDAVLGGYVGGLSERQIEMLARSQLRLRELLDLANGLLDVSRIEQGQLIPDRQGMALAPVIEATLDELRPVAEPRRLELQGELALDLPPIYGSPTRLRQVLTNLIHNAIKFTPAGGSIVVRALGGDGQVRVEVADTGTGIKPEDLPRIFGEFFRATGVKGTGTGLGLFIAQRIVEAHGGRIWAESPCPETGVGAKFAFVLPALAAEARAPATAAGEPAASQPA